MLSYWAARMGPPSGGADVQSDPLVAMAVRALRKRSGDGPHRRPRSDAGAEQDRLRSDSAAWWGRRPGSWPRSSGSDGPWPRIGRKNLSQVSIESGYFDQSHFIRDFRAVTGESPRRFFQATPYC